MHYVICYDIENDRLREKTAKVLLRHGAERLQKSVFAAPFMPKKAAHALYADLKRLYLRFPLAATDSVLMFPLRQAQVKEVLILGDNNKLTSLREKKLKIML